MKPGDLVVVAGYVAPGRVLLRRPDPIPISDWIELPRELACLVLARARDQLLLLVPGGQVGWLYESYLERVPT